MPRSESLPDPIAIAVDIGSRLDQLGIAYVIGGSLASSVHGEPRTTLDVDVVADLRPDRVIDLANALRDSYYLDVDVAQEAARTGSSFNAIHVESSIKVDLFIAGSDPFEAERLAGRISMAVTPSARLWIDTAEHVLLRKLEWYRRGGEISDHQWRDVVAIVAVQGPRLDRARLEHWARRLGVSDLLERLLAGSPA